MTGGAPRAGLPPPLLHDISDTLRRIEALLSELHDARPGIVPPGLGWRTRAGAGYALHGFVPLRPAFDPDAVPAAAPDVLIRVYSDLAGVLDALRDEIHRLTAGPAGSSFEPA